ncbi:MAG TPA: hypothetical protein GX010_02800 [Erysipelotrichaceae bacterium]|nr:hypothetical protein [Erysipelotrichaceae bacterium]
METKKKRVKIHKIESNTALYSHFGWKYSASEEARPDSTVLLVLERDKKDFGRDYGKIKDLERQYESIEKVSPIAALVTAGIGVVLYIAYFFTRPTFEYYIAFLYLALTFFAIAALLLANMIILLISKKKLLKSILNDAGLLSGAIRLFPLKNNILEEKENTWMIRNNFDN